jgi:membrane fusion protein (multidrug efflux system)
MRFSVMRPIAVVLLAAAAAGCTGKADAAKAAANASKAQPPLPVEVVAARTDTVTDAIEATGEIEAMQSIELRPDVDGRIAEILVREGTSVAKGTALFRIDDAERRAEVARARADRDLARQALDRTKDLLAQKASSQADLERAEATARSTDASLELLQIRLDRSVVRAPFSGVVGQRFVSIGDYVTSSTRLAALQTVAPQRATLQVPERFYQTLKLGQKVAFRVAALAGQEFVGTVEFVDPSVRLPARTVTVKALVPNPRNELHPGMFVEAKLATAVRTSAIVIPEDAVLPVQGKSFAYVVKDGKAERREIELGVRTPGYVEVTSGLLAGDAVAVSGLERLVDGAPVKAQLIERTPVRPEGA